MMISPIRECADAAKLGPFGEKERAGDEKTAARLCRCYPGLRYLLGLPP